LGVTIPNKSVNPERVVSAVGSEHYSAMPQSLAKILVHTVFSTKDRRPLLRAKPLREELHCYLDGILTNHDCQSDRVKPSQTQSNQIRLNQAKSSQ
jgi:hypothetical protein